MAQPRMISRREFLQSSAAAGVALAAGGSVLTGCPDRGAGSSNIAAVAIHPAVGIARVGNSPDLFYFGPEVPRTAPRSPGGFKDAGGALARQAARFRLYGLDASGKVVRELTAADGAITWTVSVANKKAAWYVFNTAMDIAVAKPVERRNKKLLGDDRRRLVPKTSASIGGTGARQALTGGTFLDLPVDFGEMTTDDKGRLVVLPGDGRAYSPPSAKLSSFSDNDDWTDNVCDGVVKATIDIDGQQRDALPAVLLVTPPNYGPAIGTGVVTLHDSVTSSLVDHLQVKEAPMSFEADILSIFARIVDTQWVNAGVLEDHGFGSAADWLDPKFSDQLADKSEANRKWRTDMFDGFRDPGGHPMSPDLLPEMYGDGLELPASNDYQWLSLTPLQHRRLKAWADGNFTDDRDRPRPPERVEDLPIEQQPDALDRAALESCLGGAYHPGIEAPWTMRVSSMWETQHGRQRLRVIGSEPVVRDYGERLTPEACMGEKGPVHGVAPGDLTMWMGVPWHGDAGSCRSGYERDISQVSPSFWPARVPNQVLSEADYQIVMDVSRPFEERMAAFKRRRDWQRHVTTRSFNDTLAAMTKNWSKLGVVTDRPGPSDGRFPSTMKVETGLGFTSEPDVVIAADGRPYS